MEHELFGVLVGASSLLAGYVLHQLSQMRARELSYLQLVPQFTSMKKLREHLSDIPDKKADVLVEGVVKKLGSECLKSDKAGIEGAARLVTTTTLKKVYNSQSGKWSDVSSTIENLNVSVPFQLVDGSGHTITVQSVHSAGGFRQILERVWQDKQLPESRSLGDFATNTTLREIPNGLHTREFLLLFGTSLGAYGTASLQGTGYISSGTITFTPIEVNSSIRGLISRNELIVSTLRFFSMLLLVGGGGILLLASVPLVMKVLGYRIVESEESQSSSRLEQ